MADPTVIDQLRPGDHVCWTFNHDQERDDGLVRYVQRGLDRRERVICFIDSVPPDHLLAHLESAGVPVEDTVAAGQLRANTSDETYLTSGAFDAEAMLEAWRTEIEAARCAGWTGLRVVGDMAWASRPVPGRDDLRWYEAEVNRVFAGGFATGLCLYDRRRFAPRHLAELAPAHLGQLTTDHPEDWEPLLRMIRTDDPPGLRLAGEIDVSNRAAFTAVMDSLAIDLERDGATADLRPRDTIAIDVSELDFADAFATHVLDRTIRRAPFRVRLVGCSPMLAQVLEIVTPVEATRRELV